MSSGAKGALAGAIVSALLLFLCVPFAMWIYRRQKRRNRRQDMRAVRPYTQLTPTSSRANQSREGSPMQLASESATAGFAARGHERYGSASSRADNVELMSLVRTPQGPYDRDRELHLGTILSMGLSPRHLHEESSEPLLSVHLCHAPLTDVHSKPRAGTHRKICPLEDVLCHRLLLLSSSMFSKTS
jgi:hypothetical protein